MAHPVEMPKLGFDMAEGTLVSWVKKEGDEVKKGDVIAEIETDKATVEVEAYHAGVMRRHLVSEGTVVPIGQTIAVIGEAGEQIDFDAMGGGPRKEEGGRKKEEGSPVPQTPGASMGELGRGAPAEAVPAQARRAPVAPARAMVPAARPAPPPSDGAPVEGGEGLPEGVRASPLARKLAADQGIDIRQIPGSGPGGRVVKRDVEAYREEAPLAEREAAPAEDVTEPLTRLRRAIGRRMTEAKQQVPHFYVTADIDMAPAMKLRGELNEFLAGQDGKISVNDLTLKACALALREYPNLNSTFQGENVLRHGQINVGIAVAIKGGLLTVVTRDTDRKSLAQLSNEARALIASAREGKVRPNDISGSTFSVSNLGMYEVDHFIAIINPPESAILAVGSVIEVPVVKDGRIVVGTRMKATVSADHRVTDGAEAAQFLQAVRRNLEQPLRLLL